MEISGNSAHTGYNIASNMKTKTNSPCFRATNERTAGYIPCYESLIGHPEEHDLVSLETKSKLKKNLILAGNEKQSVSEKEQGFSMFDFIDMINPLQHIPVLNYAYRSITGDSIKPISSIIGGAIFGGAAGAMSGLVSSVIEGEVGESVPDAIISYAKNGLNHDKQGYEAYKTASKDSEFVNRSNYKLSVIDSNYDYNV